MTALNDRPWWLIRRNLLRPSNYRALLRAFVVYERPLEVLRRYFLGGGTYPATVAVRTPAGRREVLVHGSHDVITVHEVFCRQDYRSPRPAGAVVDVGSNIGVSALWFLTRTASSRCVLYEPLPSNVERLRANLTGFEPRYELVQAAVAPWSGQQHFLVEQTGRYGKLAGEGTSVDTASIEVQVDEINAVLERAFDSLGRVDLLKLDTEGLEADTVRAIRPELLQRIGRISIETFGPTGALDGFHASRTADVVSFQREERPAR